VPDSVVIGAGPNGLAAAYLLARAGREVLVVEEAAHPGGGVWSAELTLPGFVHDVCSAVHPTAVASPWLEAMELERHGLEWTWPEAQLAHVFADGTAVALHRDVDATSASLGDPRYGELMARFLDAWPALRELGLGPWPPLAAAATAARVLGPRRLRMALGAAEGAPLGASARALLAGCGLHADLAPGERGSALFGLALCLFGHTVGWPSPRGGAKAITEAMAAACRDAGAEIRLSARAEAITTQSGAVTGVVVDGNHVPCSEVVATTGPEELATLAGAGLPERYRRALRAVPRADGALKVDWALAGPVPWRAREARRAGTVHVGGHVDELERQVAERRSGRFPQHPFLLVGQQSLADPTRTPAGDHTLWAYGLVPARVRWTDERDAVADRYEEEIERHAPGFRAFVLARAVHDPRDLERHDRNLVGGDVTGGANDLVHVVRRPTLRGHTTPVAGLVLGSASTPPGGGVHGACGANAARALLRARGRRGARRPSAPGPR
jgi:phytoene dehydrogenase-like protein